MYRAACWQTNDGCKLVELIRWQLKPFCSTLKHFVVELDRLFLKLVQFGAWLSARSISYTTLGQWLWILPWKCCLASWSSEHACLAWTWTTLYIINIYIYIPASSKDLQNGRPFQKTWFSYQKPGYFERAVLYSKGAYFLNPSSNSIYIYIETYTSYVYWNWDAAVEDLQRAKTATTHHDVPLRCRAPLEGWERCLFWHWQDSDWSADRGSHFVAMKNAKLASVCFSTLSILINILYINQYK